MFGCTSVLVIGPGVLEAAAKHMDWSQWIVAASIILDAPQIAAVEKVCVCVLVCVCVVCVFVCVIINEGDQPLPILASPPSFSLVSTSSMKGINTTLLLFVLVSGKLTMIYCCSGDLRKNYICVFFFFSRRYVLHVRDKWI